MPDTHFGRIAEDEGHFRCQSAAISVGHLESRAVLWARPTVIVDARSSDVRVAEPFLNLGDVGLVVERVGGGRRAQGMSADLEAEQRRIGVRASL